LELALFDFDHTVTTCDTYGRFLRRVATPEQHAQAWWKVGPWLLAYRLKLISAQRLRARVTRLTFTGRHLEDITAQAAGYAREVLPEVMRPEMLEQIHWHLKQQHTVVIVSGSLDLYLRPWCEAMGLDLICNRLESGDGRLTGRYAEGDCGPHKVMHIRRRYDLSRYLRIHAYGDSREDRPMLALAHERWYRAKLMKPRRDPPAPPSPARDSRA
jgi:HAD superfamily hydrolase (TIGR01490 family)